MSLSWVEIVMQGLFAFFVVMFGMNLGVILTWADRRQGALIQDRVGPQRAGIWLPRNVAKAATFLPALGAAAGVGALAWFKKDVEGEAYTAWAMFFAQAAIFFWWVTLCIILWRVGRRGVKNPFDEWLQSAFVDPRRIFYLGLGLHGVVLVAASLFKGTELGMTLRRAAFGGGAGLLFLAIVLGAGYAAFLRLRHDKVRLRLFGLLHPAADGLKFLFKEDFIPPNADRLLHSLAPIISVVPPLVVLAVVPFGDTLCFGTDAQGHIALGQLLSTVPRDGVCTTGAYQLQVVDLNVGILYFFAVAGTGVVGAAIAGWSSDNKYSLMGGLRAASQMVSYEVTLGLTVIGALMVYGTLRIDEMVRWQAANAWGIFVQPVAFVLFFAAAVAESKRIPFDLPEGESEIVAGYFTEYSSFKFAMFMFSEYVAVVASGALMVALFFGGWHLPFVYRDGIEVAIAGTTFFQVQLPHLALVLIGFLGFILKTVALCFLQLTVRWTLPRFRYDQLMHLGWRKLLPASLVNILVTGVVILLVADAGPAVLAGLGVAGELTHAVVALAGLGLLVAGVTFLLRPPTHRKVLASTSAQYAEARGGTKMARFGV